MMGMAIRTWKLHNNINKKNLKLSRYKPWRHMGEEEV
jgi:hypothetical protein